MNDAASMATLAAITTAICLAPAAIMLGMALMCAWAHAVYKRRRGLYSHTGGRPHHPRQR